jgi:hypothetical protein
MQVYGGYSMRNFNLPIYSNELRTKKDLQEAFIQLTNPLKPYFTKGSAGLQIGNTSASYSDHIASMEGFSRVLWGLAPLAAGGRDSDLWETFVQGVKNGTNPEHEEYWGDVNHYDQRLVEMAALGFSLALAPEKIWEPLNDKEQNNFSRWLLQINDHNVYDCNWLFFRVLVNLGLKKVGAGYDEEKVKVALDRLDEFYIEDGWYTDGMGGHSDYYIPFAIHFYSLIYAKIMEKEDPQRSKLYKERAAVFAKDYIYWFSKDGSAIPYGRSLTYRFAQSAFWSALAYAEVEVFSPGVIKGLVLRNLRWWFKQPIFDADGRLTIGYAYPNLVMAENYNSPGSPYWALKTFLPLCFEDNHPFWTASEEELPNLKDLSVQQKPHLVVCRIKNNSNLLAFNTGHLATNEHTHTSAKYEKFVYSTAFGFSVPRAEWGVGQGAFDSMLALSEEDNIYRVKRYCEEYKIQDNVMYSRWKPWRDVEVKTWIVYGNPWHVRIHLINTDRNLDTAEGSFALGLEHKDFAKVHYETNINETEALIKSECGASGIVNLYGERTAQVVFPNSNTNIMHSRTAIPTLTGKLKAGRHLIAAAFYGEPDIESLEKYKLEMPSIEVRENEISVFCNNKSDIHIKLSVE